MLGSDNESGNNNDTDIKDFIKMVLNVKEIDRVKLSDRYYINNLCFNQIADDRGDIIYSSDDGTYNQNFIEITYYEIDGLKNKEIQNKINEDIKNHVYEELDSINEYIDLNGSDNIYSISINTSIYGSYSDVLSITISKYVNFKSNEENETIDNYTYLNYRLDTGEYIKFEDCFTDDASIKNILTRSFYNERVWSYVENINGTEYTKDDYTAIDEDGREIYGINMDKRNYGEIEDDLFKLVLDYEKNKGNIKFSFSESYINCSFAEHFVNIPMYDYYEYIDIAKKYLSRETLYEEGNLEKINYIYSVPIDSATDCFDFISSNKFLSFQNSERMWKESYKINYADERAYDNNTINIDEERMNKELSDLKEYLTQNEIPENDKGYIYYICIYEEYEINDFGDETKINNESSKKYYFDVDRLEIDINGFKEKAQSINYEILHHISEGYIGINNLDDKELKNYNLQEYRLKRDENDNFIIENEEYENNDYSI